MTEKDLVEFVETLIPHIIKKMNQSDNLKNVARITQAKVVGINDGVATVQLPYDTNTFYAKIKTVDTISEGDNVFILYWGDLKNAHIVFKN